MGVRNNITGLWRHYKLSNIGTVQTGADASGSLLGGIGPSLKDLYLIVDSANSATQQDVSPVKTLVGTPKTKVVNIGKATDSLSINGPMFFMEDSNSSVDCTPKVLINKNGASSIYGDASSVAAAMLTSATNFTVSSNQTSYADKIGFSIDENGAKFDISMKGDPTSLFANFADPANSIAPFGYGAKDSNGLAIAGTPATPLDVALRVGTFYDFYVSAMINATKSNNTFDDVEIGGAIRSMNININIEADQITLLGMGQAPLFAISQVALEGSMKVIFPLLSTDNISFPTAVPTWQAVPLAFLPGAGSRTVVSGVPVPTPSCAFPDAPDKFKVDTITVIPKYVSNQAPLFASGAFGADIDLTNGMKVVMKSSKVNISSGVLEADMDFTGIFTTTV